jgi:hypothetical protein
MSGVAQVSVSAAAIVSQPRSVLRLQGRLEEISGILVGGSVELRSARLSFAATQHIGRMTPSDDAAGIVSRNVRQFELRGSYAADRWISLEGSYVLRTFDSPAGVQRWNMLGVGVRPYAELGTPTLLGHVLLSYLPVVSVTLPEGARRGLAAEVGVSFSPRDKPATFQMSYRFERFSFPEGSGRTEQFDGLVLKVSLRVRDPSRSVAVPDNL